MTIFWAGFIINKDMKNSKLRRLMSHELPSISSQKRLEYRTDIVEVTRLFKLINRVVFDGILPTPELQVNSNCREYWGLCAAKSWEPDVETKKSDCIIKISDKWFCKQWLIATLAHEMCHQYQWDIVGRKRILSGMKPIMSHGPTFFEYKNKLRKHGIPLKRAIRMRKWFKVQNMMKC